MSVILAIVANGDSFSDAAVTRAMLARVHWRAPDGTRVWTEGATCLGRAAFEIAEGQDRVPGPMALDHLHLVGDVRLDDRERLLADLVARGAPVESQTPDTLLVLHAWRQWSEACLQRIAGDFAFIVWDAIARRLSGAHDHYGVVPLYYSRTPTALVVSNSLTCLLGYPGLDRELDRFAVADHLTFGMKLDREGTFYRGIRRLAPGHWFESRNGDVRVRPYWSSGSAAPPDPRWRGSTYVEEFRDHFDRAVADRLQSGTASTHLSGGMDASSIAVTLARRMGPDARERLRAFTVEFTHLIPDDEGRFARQIAERSGIPLSVLDIDTALTVGPAPGDHIPPEPFRVGANPPMLLQFAEAARHGPVMFTGFGGDPVFGRASRHMGAHLSPRSLAMLTTHGLIWGDVWSSGIRAVAGGVRRLVRRTPIIAEEAPPWIDADFARDVHLADRVHGWFQAAAHPSLPAMATAPLWSMLMEQFSPDFTGHRLKFVHPFFDRRLVHFVEGVPPWPWRRGKRLLRLAMRGRLPEAILRRPKQGLRGNPGMAALQRYGPQPWMDALLDNDTLRAWVDVDQARRHLHDPACRNRWTFARLSFVWSLSWWLDAQAKFGPEIDSQSGW